MSPSSIDAAKQELTKDIGSPKVEALVEAMFLAATADGVIDPSELGRLSATLEALTHKSLSAETAQAILDELSVKLRADGRAARLAAVAARLSGEKARETALLLAASIAKSDGVVRERENYLLADLAEALAIPQGRAVELIANVTAS